MPDKILLIPNLRFNNAVATPAANPASKETSVEKNIECPEVKRTERVAPPKVNEPSTVKSGKFIILKEMTIPKTAITYNNDC